MKRIVIAVGLVLLSVTGLCGCGRNRKLSELTADGANLKVVYSPTFDNETASPVGAVLSEDETTDSPQLTALADTSEEAQEIADLYGIELDSYSYGVAVYNTDKDISELMKLGEENGYPTLAPNSTDHQLHAVQ